MSKFECICGHMIIDQTDELPYKAALISDLDTFSFYEKINNVVHSSDLLESKEELTDALIRTFNKYSKHIYECQCCGRLWMQDKGNRLIPFKAESEQYQAVLNNKHSRSS